MVVVSHLFFFLWKKLVRGAAHMSRPSHYLELSISRQPLCSKKQRRCILVAKYFPFRTIVFSFQISFQIHYTKTKEAK